MTGGWLGSEPRTIRRLTPGPDGWDRAVSRQGTGNSYPGLRITTSTTDMGVGKPANGYHLAPGETREQLKTNMLRKYRHVQCALAAGRISSDSLWIPLY
ncbi:hypothetical protein BaRGS_00019088 [Batillaria attramentaria]|uniref:Uncharacterized protein n=1 Tax=Batillaria attramentaria TaxID=370345 RepID=A0ABD0KS64_9CAEN